MNYDHNTVVTDDTDREPIIQRLLREPDVATVHVRTPAPQCFLYSVTAAYSEGSTAVKYLSPGWNRAISSSPAPARTAPACTAVRMKMRRRR